MRVSPERMLEFQHLVQIRPRDGPHLHQDLAHVPEGEPLPQERFLELGRGDQPVAHHELA